MDFLSSRRGAITTRLRSIAPLLLPIVGLIVAACNNGSGGSAY